MRTLASLAMVAIIAGAGPPQATAQTLEGYGAFGGFTRTSPEGSFIDVIKDVGGVVNARYGLTLGGFANFAVAPNTLLRAELGFAQRGFSVPPENGLRRRDLKLTYLDLAGIVRRSFPGGTLDPWLGIGPVVSIETTARGRIDDVTEDVSDETSGTDFGLALEGGMTRDLWDFGLRYVYGFSNVSKSPDPEEQFKNRGLSLTVSYRLSR